MGGGGRGRLEVFRKFIEFGTDSLPFSNLDGAPPSPSPCSPSPSPSGGWPPTKEEVVRYHKMMSKDNQCCLCNFRISDPSPEEGQLCGLLTSMWDHIEECHPEEEDWFDETFSSMFLDV